MHHEKGFGLRRPALITVFFVILMALPLVVAGCGEQMSRMEDSQVKLQAMVAANARQLATISSQLHANTGDVQQGIARLDQNDQDLSAAILTVQNDQARLEQTVTGGNQALNERMARLDENQRLLQDGVAQVAGVTERTASNVTAIAKEHATLHRMVQSNRQELAGRIAAVADTQQTMQTSIGQLHQADQALADEMTIAASRQKTLHEAMQTGNERLDAKLADIAGSQQTTRETLERNNRQLVAQLDTMAAEQIAARNTVDNHASTLADKLAAVQRNQDDIESAIAQVANTAAQATVDVAALGERQSALRETLQTNHKIVAGQVAAAIGNQETIQTGVNELGRKTDQATSRLAALESGQSATHELLGHNNEAVTTKLTALSEHQAEMQQSIDRLHRQADMIATDVAAASAEQTALRESVAAGEETLTRHMVSLSQDQHVLAESVTATLTDLSDRQSRLHRDIGGLQDRAAALALDVAAVKATQTVLHETVKAGHEVVVDQVGSLAQQQQTMQTGMAILSDKADALTAGITAHRSLVADNKALSREIISLSEGQQAVGTHLANLDARTDRLVTDVTTLADTQGTMQRTLQTQGEAIDGHMTKLAANQTSLQDQLDTVTATTGQVALDIIAVGETQTTLHERVKTGTSDLGSQITTLAEHQQRVETGINDLRGAADQIGVDVVTIGAGQDAMRETMAGELEKLARDQESLGAHLDVLTAMSGQTALDLVTMGDTQATREQRIDASLADLRQKTHHVVAGVDALADEQVSLGEALKQHEASVSDQITHVADSQQQVRHGLDTVTVTTGQTAIDVIRVAAEQNALHEGLRSHDETVARQVASMTETQAGLEQTVQANGRELTARLADIARGQQQWGRQFDAAQANVETMTAGISALEQRVTTLQGTLQANLENLTTSLDAGSGERLQFEANVNQDMQAMIDALSQLREIQTSLREQIRQIQTRTQTQAEDILSAIEQLNERAPELTVSNAGTELMPSMAEAAK